LYYRIVPDETSPDWLPLTIADFGELSAAERGVLDFCQTGARAVVAEKRPEQATERNCVRASFLRFLIVGTDPSIRMHALGIQLEGAWIIGLLDLEATIAKCEIYLHYCVFEQIELQRANVRYLVICDSIIKGPVRGDDLRTSGSLVLRDNEFRDSVSFDRSRIDGAVDCSGSKFLATGESSLSFAGAHVASAVLLRDGFIRTSKTLNQSRSPHISKSFNAGPRRPRSNSTWQPSG
jgi:hypothetical protein